MTTVLTIFGGIISIWYALVKIKAPFSFTGFDFCLVKEVGVFSFFLFLNSIIDQLNWNIDKYILGRVVGAAAIAIYSVGAQINNIYIQITDMLATVLAPRVNELVASKQNPMPDLNRLFVKVGRWQAYIVMAVLAGFTIYGREFIFLWAGPGYSEAYYVTLFLIVPVSIPLCQTLGVDIQRAFNKHQYRSVIYAFIAIGNVLISFPLASCFGAVGTAMGTGISLVIGNGIIMNIIYKKVIGLDIRRFWVSILSLIPSIIIPIFVGVIIKRLFQIESIFTLIIEVGVFLSVYLICLYAMVMNDDEKIIVKSIVNRNQ